MLYTHFKEIEKVLTSYSEVVNSSGHSLHKGNPREFFIKNFLKEHLPESVSIGTGEIIDNKSIPSEERNQFDLIIKKNNFPKINFGGDTNCYFVESVAATIEVKSTITKTELKKAILAARKIKNLEYSYKNNDYKKIRSFLVAYKSRAEHIDTIYKWIKEIQKEEGITLTKDSGTTVLEKDNRGRPTNTLAWCSKHPSANSPTLNGIFILNKGSIVLNNGGFSFKEKGKRFDDEYLRFNEKDKNIMLLFLYLLESCANEPSFNIHTYMQNITLQAIIDDSLQKN